MSWNWLRTDSWAGTYRAPEWPNHKFRGQSSSYNYLDGEPWIYDYQDRWIRYPQALMVPYETKRSQ